MKIAIIGAGISGLTAAYYLRRNHQLSVFEVADKIGGHTATVDVNHQGCDYAIDTGFIVYNDWTYPNFIELMDELGVDSQPTEMSFSVRCESTGIEYGGSNLNAMFAQRRNLLRPSFHKMISDILKFNREAIRDLENGDISQEATLGEYLRANQYGEAFVYRYILPMGCAIWSASTDRMIDFPLRFFVQFFKNHGLLSVNNRPQWRVIKGGSREYVRRLVHGHRDSIRLNSPVQQIRRSAEGIEITTPEGGREWYDYAFVACHSDQALKMLAQPGQVETEVLGAIDYQLNEAVLHTDVSVLPARRRAWAAWNYFVPAESHGHVAVSYNMNILQSLDSAETYVVTLNDNTRIDPEKILHRVEYHHPVFTRDTIAAQARHAEINSDRIFYCGAYWRNGFHEDGVVSALDAVSHFEEALKDEELHLRRAG